MCSIGTIKNQTIMFNIPIKKQRGVEKGSFVALKESIVNSASQSYSSNVELSSDSITANSSLFFVVDDSAMGSKGLIRVIPLVYENSRDYYQTALYSKILRKEKSYLYKREDLKIILEDPDNYLMDRSCNVARSMNSTLTFINQFYKNVIKDSEISMEKYL